jgi:chromosome segregation ATPase
MEMTVKTELLRQEQIEILPLEMDRLVAYAKLQHIPPAVRDALTQIIQLKQAASATQQQLEDRRRRIGEISTEQARIRENMKAVSQTTDYYTRLIKKLDDQETQIEAIQKEAASLSKQLDSERKELETRVGQLTA